MISTEPPHPIPPTPSTSTWGGGSGITVIYGVAAPLQPPCMGLVRQPEAEGPEGGQFTIMKELTRPKSRMGTHQIRFMDEGGQAAAEFMPPVRVCRAGAGA
ncbi:MAG: hypothetical protein QNK29_02445 [Desulfobacterales bacterium]|nr:hypothetical protein [Desulfobacterales bacterium]